MAITTKFEFKNSNLITNRIFDDDVGRFLAETCANQFNKYVPMDSGTLSQHVTTEPFKITYESRYAKYQWEGVSKSGKPLNYSNIDLQEAIGNKVHIEIDEMLLFHHCRITLSIDRRD